VLAPPHYITIFSASLCDRERKYVASHRRLGPSSILWACTGTGFVGVDRSGSGLDGRFTPWPAGMAARMEANSSGWSELGVPPPRSRFRAVNARRGSGFRRRGRVDISPRG
jgi:hypothetical protein